MRIIPAIDLINGKCVRLQKGDYSRETVYANDPLEVAQSFEQIGVKYLHLVDLDGARLKAVQNWNVIESICSNTSLTVDFGGGIRSEEEVSRLLDAGVAQLNIGSLAVNNPDTLIAWMQKFGGDRFILSVDIKDGLVASHGWMETSTLKYEDFVKKFTPYGLGYIVSTDVARDGMMSGPNLELYEEMVKSFPDIKIVASGGISSHEDMEALIDTGVDGAITGKAIYEGALDLKKLIQNAD